MQDVTRTLHVAIEGACGRGLSVLLSRQVHSAAFCRDSCSASFDLT
jgi:hypothetical protein